MAALSPDVSAALASLQARLGAAAPRVVGALATAPLPAEVEPDEAPQPAPSTVERIVRTGFPALDAILGPGGLPRSASVALRGDASSGKTTLALRLAAEAQADGAIVAWLDLARALDPVEAVARGVRLDWLVVLTPDDARRGPLDRRGAARRPIGRPARHRPPAAPGPRHDRREGRRSVAPPRGPRPSVGDAARRPRAAGPRRRPRDCRRGIDRPPPRARPPVVDPARARRRRPADGGDRRPQPVRSAGEAGGAPDPLRRGRRARSPASAARTSSRRPCRRRRHRRRLAPPPAPAPTTDPTDATPPPLLAPSSAPARDAARRSDSFPTDRPVVLGGQPWTDGTVIDADPAARALGVRRGIPLGSAHRLAPEAAFLDPEPDADAASVEAAFEILARSARGSPGRQRPGRSGLRPARGPGRRPASGCGGARRSRRRGSSRRSRRILPGRPGRGSPGRGSRRRSPPATPTPAAPRIVRPGGEAAFLGAAAGVAAHAGPGRPGPARGGSGCARSGRSRSCRGRRSSPGSARRASGSTPGPTVEEIEPVPAATRAGAPRAWRCRSSPPVAELELAPVRAPPAGRRARRSARGARRGRGPGPSPAGARRHVRRSRDAAGRQRRAALPRADRRRRGDRATAVRPARADAAAGAGREARAGAGRRRAGRRAATAAVRAAGRAERPARAGSWRGSR